jgi:hypothetical protein
VGLSLPNRHEVSGVGPIGQFDALSQQIFGAKSCLEVASSSESFPFAHVHHSGMQQSATNNGDESEYDDVR